MMCGGSFCVWSILVAAAFLVSGLALSVKACRLCQIPPFVAARHLPPERGKSFLKGRAFGITVRFPAKTRACLPGRANPLSPLPLVASSSPEGGALDIFLSAQKALPSGELARERLRGISLLKAGRSFLCSAALSQKAALQMPFSSTTPPVKMGYRNARRRSDIPKFKIILPLTMPKAQRRAF